VKLSSGFVAVGKRKGAVKCTIHDDDFPQAFLSIWLGAIRRMWACRLGCSVVTADEHDHCNRKVLKPGTLDCVGCVPHAVAALGRGALGMPAT
jgi:hypothetical protein